METPAFETVAAYWRQHSNSLYRNTADSLPSNEWFDTLATSYRDGDENERLKVLASVLNEAERWNAITRSMVIFPNFEQATGQHICALWNDCEHVVRD